MTECKHTLRRYRLDGTGRLCLVRVRCNRTWLAGTEPAEAERTPCPAGEPGKAMRRRDDIENRATTGLSDRA